MSVCTWVDGIACEHVPTSDRGLRYGDGVFETMAVRDARVVVFDRHLARLARGCAVLGVAVPDLATLQSDLRMMNLPDQAVARLIVTRGSGGRGYAPAKPSSIRRIWELHEWPEFDPDIYRNGIHVAWLQTNLSLQPALAGIKHLGRVEQVLAARELDGVDADDGLLSDTRGQVIEAVSANVFVRSGKMLSTPMLDQCGVAGVVRERVLTHAKELGFDTRVTTLRSADFSQAAEIFLTSSIRGVVPVRKLAARSLADFSAANAYQLHFAHLDGISP